MTEPYMAHPVSPMEAAGLGIAAVAVPTISAILISRVVNSVVDIIVPLDEKRERNKFYNHSQRVIKESSLPSGSSSPPLHFVEDESDEIDDSKSKGWIDHVERAKEELDIAHKKVRCGKCKKDIAEVKSTLESRTNEMVRNAKRHKTMTGLQNEGKIRSGKTWKQLTSNEKKMIKSMEI